MTRRYKQIGVVIGVVVACLLMLLIAGLGSKGVVLQARPVPAIFSSAAPYGNNSVVFSNGRQFVSYDYVTGVSRALSGDGLSNGLTNIDRIYASDDGKYLAFHNKLAAADGPLDAALKAAGQDSSLSYWWIYDIGDGSYHVLPQGVSSVRFNGDVAYALSNGTNGSQLTTYAPPAYSPGLVVAVAPSDDFFLSGGSIFLNQAKGDNTNGADGAILQTTDGVSNKVLSATGRVVGSNGSAVFMETGLGAGQGSDIYVLTVPGSSKRLVAKNVDGQTVLSEGNALFYRRVAGKGKTSSLYLYDAAARKTERIAFSDTSLSSSSLSPVGIFGQSTGLVEDQDTNYYLMGRRLASIHQPGKHYNKTVQVGATPIDLAYYPDQSAFIVTLDKDSAEAQRMAVYAQLTKDGIDPRLTDIRFSLYTPPPVLD